MKPSSPGSHWLSHVPPLVTALAALILLILTPLWAYQFYQQPFGWPGEKVTTDMPVMTNIRQDPFERTSSLRGESLNHLGGGYMNDFFAREFWRFVLVQQYVAKLAATAIEYPPMQDAATFNLDAVKKQVEAMIREHHGQ